MDGPKERLPAGISSLCRRTDRLLWEAYSRSNDISVVPDRCRLLFSRYREKEDLRVSEQEARFAFLEALCRGGTLRYSVETPTDKLYQFTGETQKVSAQTDLTIYDLDTRRRLCNVEFKEGGITPSAQKKSKYQIYKDVEKLLREPVWGLWFHLLESTERLTISKFLGVIKEGIGKVRSDFGNEIDTPGLTFHVCVLKHGFSLQKDVPLSTNDPELTSHLHVDLCVSRSELFEKQDLNGWELNRKV